MWRSEKTVQPKIIITVIYNLITYKAFVSSLPKEIIVDIKFPSSLDAGTLILKIIQQQPSNNLRYKKNEFEQSKDNKNKQEFHQRIRLSQNQILYEAKKRIKILTSNKTGKSDNMISTKINCQ